MKKFKNIIEFYNSLKISDVGVIYNKEDNEDATSERIIVFKVTIGKEFDFYGQTDEILIRKYKKYKANFSQLSHEENGAIIWYDNNYELSYGHDKEKEEAEFFILDDNKETAEFFHQTSGNMGFFDQMMNYNHYTSDYIKDRIGKLRT